jgi:hypothetical protein
MATHHIPRILTPPQKPWFIRGCPYFWNQRTAAFFHNRGMGLCRHPHHQEGWRFSPILRCQMCKDWNPQTQQGAFNKQEKSSNSIRDFFIFFLQTVEIIARWCRFILESQIFLDDDYDDDQCIYILWYSMITERHQKDPKGIHIEVLRWSNMIQTRSLWSMRPASLQVYEHMGCYPKTTASFWLENMINSDRPLDISIYFFWQLSSFSCSFFSID